MITAEVIQNLNSPYLGFVSGDVKVVAKKVLPPEIAEKGALIFVSKADQLMTALLKEPAIIIGHKSLTPPENSSVAYFTTPSVHLAMATILPLFDGKMNRFVQEQKIHPSACIDPTAHLGQNVSVGPFVVIGAGARVGDGTTLASHVVIESEASVGDHCLMHPHVFIGAHCTVGSHCEFHPHVTIGADGFSFAPNKEGVHQKIPQIGTVVIGNHVELGASCAIDRAALTETRIGNGTKMDNFCHVGHNCDIGEHNVFAAGLRVAGSCKIGSYCTFGGGVDVADHVTICDRVMLGGRAGVSNDITKPGAYSGHPLEPIRDYLKTVTNMAYLTRMRKDLHRVLKHLNLHED